MRRWQVFGMMAVCAALAGLLPGCALPPLEGRSESTALSAAEGAATRLGQALAPQVAAHPGQSGILSLSEALDAFAARVLLVHAAERTLDVQYYIWRDDITGTLLLDALRQAAERGVRVRLLLDDNGVSGLDATLLELDRHPRIEVRLFNPFVVRRPKAIGFLHDFGRLNRRMHNKALIADNQAAIMGGRNVGDEYFGATDDILFADLDVLAMGQVVPELSADFDRYWASASAYPIDRIVTAGAPPEESLAQRAVRTAQDPRAQQFLRALRESRFIPELLGGTRQTEWAPVEMVSDDPAKGLGDVRGEGLLAHQMQRILARPPQVSLDLVSPYFVPTAGGAQVFAGLAGQGVRVRILTNALEATDVSAVHSGYARYREELLRAGVQLYEMKRGTGMPMQQAGLLGSSGSSLHAKTFVVDGRRVFVGSMNFDPRSIRLNTELGFIIDSPALAQALEQAFERDLPTRVYGVRLGEDGRLAWVERRENGPDVVHRREPGITLGRRLWLGLLSVLPIEWML